MLLLIACKDDRSGCSGWARAGYCTMDRYKSFMTKYCKLSCGVCKGINFCYIIKFQLSNYVIITNSYDMGTYII